MTGSTRLPSIGSTMFPKLLPILLALTILQTQDCASTILTGKCEDMKPTISLRFSEAGLQSIAPNFLDSPYVSCVSLDGNEIRTINFDAFSKAPNLLYLDLSRNKLRQNELLSFKAPPSLKTLVLDGNMPQDNYYSHHNYGDIAFGPIVEYFPNLTNLYLRENNLKRFSFRLSFAMPNLTHLYLDGNRIDVESLYSTLPRGLISLSLKNNFITWMDQLTDFEELFLDRNQIESLCSLDCYGSFLSLSGSRKLRVLSLSENGIKSISSNSFVDTTNLTSLDLSGNAISSIKAKTFQFLTVLRNLSLANNSMTEIPDLCPMPELRYVNFSYNQIRSIAESSLNCTLKLQVLHLEGNAITTIDENSFSKFTNLEVLNLSNNNLKIFPQNWLHHNLGLRLLYVERNFIDNLNDLALSDPPKLTDIYFGCNPLKSLNTFAFRAFSQNLTIHLKTDCSDTQ